MPSISGHTCSAQDFRLKKKEQKLLKQPIQPRDGTTTTKQQFLAAASEVEMDAFGQSMVLKPKMFSRGKVGFFVQGKVPLTVDGRNYTLQCTGSFYVPHSETWAEGTSTEKCGTADDGEEESDEASEHSDEEPPEPAIKRVKAEKGHYMFRNVWISDAPKQTISVFGKTITVFPQEFKTGSVGYFCDREFHVVVGGQEYLLKTSLNATIVGSKKWERG